MEKFKQDPNNDALAYFYCDRNTSDRQDPTFILSSFVRQLSAPKGNDTIPHSIVQMYNQKQKTDFASGVLKSRESQTLLGGLLQLYSQIIFVVDALDECDKKTRLEFVAMLEELMAKSSSSVKVLISSRRDGDIKQHFENGPNLEIRAIDNQDDIGLFVNHEIVASEKVWQFDISSGLRELICETFVERSGGM